MKIHVTGAKGFLGKYVVECLQEVAEVTGTDVDDMDIMDYDKVLETLKKDIPDVIIHLAALQGRVASRGKPIDCIKVNALGTTNILEACKELGIKKFVLMSSITVHGKSEGQVNEESPIRPLHPYGASKAAAEAIVHSYSVSYDINAAIFRPNFIVAPIPSLEYTESLIFNFMKLADKDGGIKLAGDGHFEREWTHAKDIAEALKLGAMSNIKGCETFMLCTPENRISMAKLASKICKVVGKGKVSFDSSMEGFSLISSNKKAVEMLKWVPKIKIDQILEEIWDGYKSLQ